ncbi:MAG: hypothetical protein PVG65_06905 [Candidatus Thorarchaeota archaeon]|jgi:hypothetical protein
MQIKIEKRYIATIISVILLLAFAGYVIAVEGVSHTADELPSDVDTRCDVSGTCSQVCVGSDCRNSWPSGGAKGTLSCVDRTHYPPYYNPNPSTGQSFCAAYGEVCTSVYTHADRPQACSSQMLLYQYIVRCCKVV